MSDTEKVWVQGPSGAIVSLNVGTEIAKVDFDRRVAAGELTVVDNPEKQTAKKATKKVEAEK